MVTMELFSSNIYWRDALKQGVTIHRTEPQGWGDVAVRILAISQTETLEDRRRVFWHGQESRTAQAALEQAMSDNQQQQQTEAPCQEH